MTSRGRTICGALVLAIGAALPGAADIARPAGSFVPVVAAMTPQVQTGSSPAPETTQPAAPAQTAPQPGAPQPGAPPQGAPQPGTTQPGAPQPGTTPPAPKPPAAPPTRTPPPPPFHPAWSASIVHDGALDVVAANGIVVIGGAGMPMEAHALTDGSLSWTSLPARTIAAGEGVIYGMSDRQIYAVNAATGDLDWVTSQDGVARSLTATPDVVLAATTRTVAAFRRDDGAPIWSVPLSVPPAAPIATAGPAVLVALEDRTVLSLDLATGAERWRRQMDEVPVALTAADPFVYVSLPTLAACGLRAEDGRIDWCTWQLRVPIIGAPVVTGERLQIALRDGTLRTLDRRTGTILRNVPLSGLPAASPMQTGGEIVVALTSGELFVARAVGADRRVPATEAAGGYSLEKVTASDTPPAIVTLAIAPGGERALTALVPPPPGAKPGTRQLPTSGELPTLPSVQLAPPPPDR